MIQTPLVVTCEEIVINTDRRSTMRTKNFCKIPVDICRVTPGITIVGKLHSGPEICIQHSHAHVTTSRNPSHNLSPHLKVPIRFTSISLVPRKTPTRTITSKYHVKFTRLLGQRLKSV
jgi:hypothetical protein